MDPGEKLPRLQLVVIAEGAGPVGALKYLIASLFCEMCIRDRDTTAYPIDCVYTQDELDTIDKWRVDFENFVAEQEATWLRDGGITDETWNAYKENLNRYGMQDLLETYQAAYDRYTETMSENAA